MKSKYSIVLVTFLFVLSTGYSQESAKKTKEQKKAEKQEEIKRLVDARTFIFTGITAYSQKGRSVNISSGANSVSFSPDMIKSDLPFFGEAKTASAAFGGQSGYKFEGKPDKYTLEPYKKGWKLFAVVNTGNEKYTMNLTVGTDGNANLNVFSINRSQMRYSGDIKAVQ